MTERRHGGLLLDLWEDLQDPNILWQAATLLLCLTMGWLTALLLQRWLTPSVREGRLLSFGRRGAKRVLPPLVSLLMLLAARPMLSQWHHVNLLNLAVPLLVSLTVIRAVVFIVRQSFSEKAPWLSSFERFFAFSAWAVVALHILGVLPEVIAFLESVHFTVGRQRLDLWLVLQGVAMVLLTILFSLWLGGLLEARLLGMTGLDVNVRLVLARLARALLLLIAILVGLPAVGIDLTMLSVFGGALGVGLGFGLQKIAANYVSGFIILLERSLAPGNLIQVGDFRGRVERITTRYTVLKGLGGVEWIVPNEMLVSSVIANETLSDTKVRQTVRVSVAYGTDLVQAMALMAAAAQAQSRVLADPPPKAFIVEYADSGILLELAFWIADPEEGTMGLKSDILLAIGRAFTTAGIVIPFPQREVRIIGG